MRAIVQKSSSHESLNNNNNIMGISGVISSFIYYNGLFYYKCSALYTINSAYLARNYKLTVISTAKFKDIYLMKISLRKII